MKKIFFLSIFFLFSLLSFALAQSSEDHFFYGDNNTVTDTTTATQLSNIIKQDIVEPNNGVLKKTLRLFHLDQFITLSNSSALEFVKYIINIALGLVSFIALVVIIYGFAKVFFAEDDKWVTEARKTIQGAAIAIAIIAISWFIVTFLFYLYGQFVQ